MRLLRAALVLGTLVACQAAFADASLTLNIDSNPVQPQIVDSDPAALSDVLDTEIANTSLSATSSYAEGAADLTAGTLRCRAAAMATGGGDFPSCTATIRDQLTFAGPGTTVAVMAKLTIDGGISMHQSMPGDSSQDLITSIEFGNDAGIQSAGIHVSHTFSSSSPEQWLSVASPPGANATNSGGDGAPSIVLVVMPTVTIGVPTGIVASINITGMGQMGDIEEMDLGNTARLELIVPSGYTYTSSSGNFLTQVGAPGLPLPPDGGAGVHGAADGGSVVVTDAGTSSSMDASAVADGGTTPGDAGSTKPSSSGGCSVTSTANGCGATLALLLLLALGVMLRERRA